MDSQSFNFIMKGLLIIVGIGTIIAGIVKFILSKKRGKSVFNRIWIVTGTVVTACFCFIASGVLNSGMEQSGEYIMKNHPSSIDSVTYGQVFDVICGNMKWSRIYKDYSSNGLSFVQLDADCNYGGEDKKITIQFNYGVEDFETVNENTPFCISFVGFDDEENTSTDMMQEYIFKMFEHYADGHQITLDESMKDGILYTSGWHGMETKEQAEDETLSDDLQEGYEEHIKEEFQEDLADGTVISKDSACFPIMFKGYEGAECPVMVQDEQNGELVSGTYEEMLASCVDDGITMFAPPTYYNGFIYTATKWDAYPEQWYDGLLTYNEFVSEVNKLAGIGEVAESSNPYSNMFIDEEAIPYEEIAGSYSGISTDGCSISMYSSIEDEKVGIIQFIYNGNDLSGELINPQTNVYQVLTSDGTEVIFGVFTDNGNINLDVYVNGMQTDYMFLYEHYYS